jgi:hypothetical protein
MNKHRSVVLQKGGLDARICWRKQLAALHFNLFYRNSRGLLSAYEVEFRGRDVEARVAFGGAVLPPGSTSEGDHDLCP